MNRTTAIRQIIDSHPQAFFILSNGLTSREAAFFMPGDNCFYLLHAMGEALAVGVGLAKCCEDKKIVVIDGDGNALMGLSSWSLMPVKNLKYYVLKNGIYETTGGQSLPNLPSCPDWLTIVDIDPGKEKSANPPPPEQIWQKAMGYLQK